MSDVTLTIDGKQITVPAGTLIIRAAEQLGVQIPRFCDHPLLEPAGACRQCFVEVEGQRKLITSCTTPVTEGMVVRTQDTGLEAKTAQVANLEFLLLNHPLDCPVCDRGGECPLQDQALEFGPGESRFIEAKRTYEKPLPLSDLVALDRERCVLCARCTRFCDEISGDRQIELFDRGARQQVAIAEGEEFDSPFSGNTIQICPVGALTARPYRFAARPFDLTHADSVCEHCSAGCNIRVDARRGEMARVLARDNLDVNDAWTCDKGRFAFAAPDAEDRVTTPLLREGGLIPVSFDEAFGAIAGWASEGPVGVLTGGRLGDLDAYALSKLARVALGTNDIDHRRHLEGGALELAAASGALDVTYADVERAKVIVVAGLDTEQEVPILHLRIRKAVRRSQSRVWVAHSRVTRLHDVAEHVLTVPGGEAAALRANADVMGALSSVGSDAVVLVGEQVAGVEGATDALLRLAAETGARVAFVTRRAGDRGALRAGVHPSLLPGGRRIDNQAERNEVQTLWGDVPTTQGRDAAQILQATAAQEIHTLIVVGADPLRDWPDAKLAAEALSNARHVVVVGLELGEMDYHADVFLPAAASIEREGSRTTWEGRSQPFHAVRGPLGSSRADVEIFTGLADALGQPIGGPEELAAEMVTLLAPRADAPITSSSQVAGAPVVLAEDGGFLLTTYPTLVDAGRLSIGAEALHATQGRPAWVEVGTDAGIESGALVRVTTPAGSVELTARVGELASGVAFIPFNDPGCAANELLSGRWSTSATIEPVGDGPDGDEAAEANDEQAATATAGGV